MARPPRIPLHDQVTAVAIMLRLDGFESYLDNVAKDAREGRDAALGLVQRMSAENTQAELQKIWARMEKSDAEHREDLRNSYARLSEAAATRYKELELDRDTWKRRVEDLEAWRHKIEGANGLLGWVAKHSPWLVTVAVAVLALLKVKAP